jgi:UDP-N-acetylmuramoylalanine--D-glutamate ligase
MRQVQGKHIVVIGAARSGVAAACLLHRQAAEVFVTDKGAVADAVKERLSSHCIAFEEHGHTDRARGADFAVLSPGVPTSAPLVQEYLKAGKNVYSEIEVASWFNKSAMVAVTGSNGKTTVTSWLAHTWKKAGRDYVLAGNIGFAFADKVEDTDPGKEAILEVSSFQLDHIDSFRPHISLLLNITADHMDRYQNSFENYAKSKFRITQNQTGQDWFIYNYDDPAIRDFTKSIRQKKARAPRMLAFSQSAEPEHGAFVRDNNIIIRFKDEEHDLMPISELSLRGSHNLNNGLATALAARAAEIKNDIIRESLRTFEGVEHRLEHVRTLDGVRYINDSKATNINAVWYALDSINVPMVLILGGRDKGNDYTSLSDQIREKVHTIVAIGEAQSLIEEQLKPVVPQFEKASTLEEAVRLGRKFAKRGEVVLLSPACASFDMFESYEHRGDEFKRAVNAL